MDLLSGPPVVDDGNALGREVRRAAISIVVLWKYIHIDEVVAAFEIRDVRVF